MTRLNSLASALLMWSSAFACHGAPPPQQALETQSAAKTPVAAPAKPSGTKLGIATSPSLGRYVTDANGRALYLLEGLACADVCLAVWPPLASPSAPEPGDTGLEARLMGTTKRPDGIPQATYGGHALYYYVGIARLGTRAGNTWKTHGASGIW